MSRKFIKILSFILAVLMILMLAACNNENGNKNNNPGDGNSSESDKSGDNNSQNDNKNTNQLDTEFVYTAAYKNMKADDISSIDRITYANGRIYMIAWEITGKTAYYYDEDYNIITDEERIAEGDYAEFYEYDETKPAIYSMETDGSNFKRLDAYQIGELPEGQMGNVYISSLSADDDGNLWVVEEYYSYHYDDEGVYYDDGSGYNLKKLDATGATIGTFDLSQLVADQEYFYINYFIVDGDGALYISGGSEQCVFVIGSDGELLFKLQVDNWINSLIRLKDGKIGAMSYAETGYVLRAIDKTTKDFGDSIPIPYNVYNLLNGGGEYDYYYTNGFSLCGYNTEEQKETVIVNWIDSDVNPNNLSNVVPLEDGRILGISYNWASTGTSYELVMLTKTDPADIPVKEILTFACMYIDYNVLTRIIDFNKTSDKYRIRVDDYSVYNTADDYNAGLTKLTTEIIAGRVPDIFATSSMPLQRFITKGLVEDLTPYIENDPELGIDAILPGVLNALRVNGGIYQSCSSFNINTVVGPSSLVGDTLGWNIQQFKAAMANAPEGASLFANTTRDDMLNLICMMNQNSYIDWATGKCDFNNENFISLLELAKTFPKEIIYDEETYISEYQLILEGKAVLSRAYISSFDDIQTYKAIYEGDITFIGFPAESGSGSIAYFYDGLSMSSTCSNKDAAWSFIRYLFTEEYQTGENNYSWNLPTNKAAMDKKIADTLAQNDTSGSIGILRDSAVSYARGSIWISNDLQIDLEPVTQEDIDQVMELINNVDGSMSFDQDIYAIILEDAQAFFEGQKTAQDVAATIQSRVTIYVNEQR